MEEILKEAKMLISNRPQSVTLASTIAKLLLERSLS